MGAYSVLRIIGFRRAQSSTGVASAGTSSGFRAAALILAATVAGLALAGCGKKVDPDAPFQMSLNGNPYLPGVGQPRAVVADIEAGFSELSQCTIIFPLNALKNRPQPGLEIIFDPAAIPVGEEVSLGDGVDGPSVQLAYYPFFGGMSQDGKLTVYSIGGEGSARIRFDDIDLEARHIQGVLLEAVLYGVQQDADGQLYEPEKPQEMRLSNFPFDVEITGEVW